VAIGIAERFVPTPETFEIRDRDTGDVEWVATRFDLD
jgi:catalase (peroxidase I)